MSQSRQQAVRQLGIQQCGWRIRRGHCQRNGSGRKRKCLSNIGTAFTCWWQGDAGYMPTCLISLSGSAKERHSQLESCLPAEDGKKKTEWMFSWAGVMCCQRLMCLCVRERERNRPRQSEWEWAAAQNTKAAFRQCTEPWTFSMS